MNAKTKVLQQTVYEALKMLHTKKYPHLSFLDVIDRAKHDTAIQKALQGLVQQANQDLDATIVITSATPLSDSDVRAILAKLHIQGPSQVVVDPTLLGGVIISHHSRELDLSLKGRLSRLSIS